MFFFLQFLPDSYTPVEREHRYGAAGSASGCQECRPGGKHTETVLSDHTWSHDRSGDTKLDSAPVPVRYSWYSTDVVKLVLQSGLDEECVEWAFCQLHFYLFFLPQSIVWLSGKAVVAVWKHARERLWSGCSQTGWACCMTRWKLFSRCSKIKQQNPLCWPSWWSFHCPCCTAYLADSWSDTDEVKARLKTK